jgi:hypothetical protein
MRLIFSQDPRLKMHIKAPPLTHKSKAPQHYRRGFTRSVKDYLLPSAYRFLSSLEQ